MPRKVTAAERTDRRIGLLAMAFLFVFLMVLLRAGWLQGVRGAELRAQAHDQQTEGITVPGHRGTILDRSGEPLAISEDASTIFATPYQLDEEGSTDKAIKEIAEILEVPESDLHDAISQGTPGFAYLAHRVDEVSARKIENLGLVGVGSIPDSARNYPQGNIASQIIGVVGNENQGLFGLEAGLDETLAGIDGSVEVVRDARGDEIDREEVEDPIPGQDVKLALDANIQAQTEDVLNSVAKRTAPAGASAIVMDPRNSNILAMASWPPADLEDVEAIAEGGLKNLGTGFTYEPGSTFKAITVAAAMEEGLVAPSTEFSLAPTIQVADRTISESHGGGGILTTAEILAQSSNVGSVTIGLELGADRFDEWIRRFGFGSPTGVDFPGEEQGILLDVDDYSGSTMGNVPIGQGLAVTPMQMAASYAAIANGGKLRPPRLILNQGGERVRHPKGERVISRNTATELRDMLKGVLAPGGTASEVVVPGYELAGKTGTAQKAIEGGYSESQYVASFIGFAPADDPRLLVSVVVDAPSNGDYYGSSVAAPAFGEIVKFALPYMGVRPEAG